MRYACGVPDRFAKDMGWTIKYATNISLDASAALMVYMKYKRFCANVSFADTPEGHRPLPMHQRLGKTAVTMLRHPARRLESAWAHRKHHFGMPHELAVGLRSIHTIEDFARYPGIAGCQTKMILGYACSAPVSLTANDALEAVEILRDYFAFVGITDRWKDSLHLFHAMLGGTVHSMELVHVRRGPAHATETSLSLTDKEIGQLDPVDWTFYRAALSLFNRRMREYCVGSAKA